MRSLAVTSTKPPPARLQKQPHHPVSFPASTRRRPIRLNSTLNSTLGRSFLPQLGPFASTIARTLSLLPHWLHLPPASTPAGLHLPASTMESLTLADGQQHYRRSEHYRSKDRRHRSSRLPTPDDSQSQSSNDAMDSRSPSDAGLQIRTAYARPPLPDQDVVMGGTGAVHLRRDSRNTTVPYSPPYRAGDGQKPSLPPLKTASPVWL